MKRSLWAGALLIAAVAPWSVAQANGVAVSVSTPEFGFTIGRPFYGPPVVAVPVYMPPPPVIMPTPVFVPRYLHSPHIVAVPRPIFVPSHQNRVNNVHWRGHDDWRHNRGRGHHRGRDD